MRSELLTACYLPTLTAQRGVFLCWGNTILSFSLTSPYFLQVNFFLNWLCWLDAESSKFWLICSKGDLFTLCVISDWRKKIKQNNLCLLFNHLIQSQLNKLKYSFLSSLKWLWLINGQHVTLSFMRALLCEVFLMSCDTTWLPNPLLFL